MKNILLTTGTLMLLFFTTQLSAQREIQDTPPVFITLGLGVNHTGILSLGLEVPVHEKVAIFGDAGLGGWGYKFGAGVGYFPQSVSKGSGINLAYYTAGGTGNGVTIELEDGNGTFPVSLERTGTINLTYSQNWHMGRRGKFSLIAGYALATGDKDSSYNVFGRELDELGEAAMGILHPDGLIIGFKFLFGVGGRR